MEEEITQSQNNTSDNAINNTETENYKVINNIKYIGILYFPSISNLSVPVTDTLDSSNLKKGSCRYYGDFNTKMVIGGHNYKSVFGKLEQNLKINDEIYLKQASGTITKYVYKEKQELKPEEVQKLVNTSYDLTIFTCTYDNFNRLAFRFEII